MTGLFKPFSAFVVVTALLLPLHAAVAQETTPEASKRLELKTLQKQLQSSKKRADAIKGERKALQDEADRLSGKLAELAASIREVRTRARPADLATGLQYNRPRPRIAPSSTE